jgi:hypothetical protein
MAARPIIVRIGADISDFEKGVRKLERSLGPLQRSMQKVGGAMTRGITAPVLGAAAALTALAVKSANYADEIDKMAIRTGLSTDTLQELRFATDQLGVSFSAVQTATDGLTRRLLQADEEGSKVADVMASIGVSVRDAAGEFRSMDELFPDVISKLSGLRNETERNALAVKIFGGAASELTPLLNAGEEGLEQLTKQARQMGLVMSRDSIDALVRFKDQVSALKMQFGAASNEIGAAFVPLLTEHVIPLIQATLIPAMRGLAGMIARVTTAFNALSAPARVAISVFAALVVGIGPLILGVGMMIKTFTVLSAVMTPLTLKIAAVIAAVSLLAGAAYVIYKSWEPIKDFFGALWDAIVVIHALAAAKILEQINRITSLVGINLEETIDKVKEVGRAAAVSLAGREVKTFGDLWSRMSGVVTDSVSEVAARMRALRTEARDTVVALNAVSEKLKSFRVEGEDPNDPWARMARLRMRIRNMNEGRDRVNFRTRGLPFNVAMPDAVIRTTEAVVGMNKALYGTADAYRVIYAYGSQVFSAATVKLVDTFSYSIGHLASRFDEFEDVAKELKNILTDTFRTLLAQLSAAIIRAGILAGIMAAIPGFGTAAGIGGMGFGGLLLQGMGFGGFRAAGGPVRSGMSYLVGERGPELFTPGSSGAITPNHALGGMQIQVTGRLVAEGNELVAVIDRAERRNRVIGI